MGDPRGFLKVKRKKPSERPASERIGDYREFVVEPSESELHAQASRCMDCGVPFCHRGCPLGNVIPEFNEHVWGGRIEDAVRVLHSTNNFPEITGRVCPAPCEASCVLGIENVPVTIKDIERAIARAALEGGGLTPRMARRRSEKKVAIVGSGPAGLAAAQELARRGHDVVVFERDARVGGLLQYGIPDFKLEKSVLEPRIEQMRAEGVSFRTSVDVGRDIEGPALLADFDAVVLCLGARRPRDLHVPGRDLAGVHFAMDYLVAQNERLAGHAAPSHESLIATGKHVVVIGGGDTGSDCVGTANRQRAASVTQLELMAKPPLVRIPENPWPAWPLVFRTSSSQEEGCERDFGVMTQAFVSTDAGAVRALRVVRVELSGGVMREIPDTSLEIPCDLALLAMGFVGPEAGGIGDSLGVTRDDRGNLATNPSGATNVPKVFAAGDANRGQSLVVWAIADGRRVARGVDEYLREKMNADVSPRESSTSLMR